jgi:hypothetical protein
MVDAISTWEELTGVKANSLLDILLSGDFDSLDTQECMNLLPQVYDYYYARMRGQSRQMEVLQYSTTVLLELECLMFSLGMDLPSDSMCTVVEGGIAFKENLYDMKLQVRQKSSGAISTLRGFLPKDLCRYDSQDREDNIGVLCREVANTLQAALDERD